VNRHSKWLAHELDFTEEVDHEESKVHEKTGLSLLYEDPGPDDTSPMISSPTVLPLLADHAAIVADASII
jgi:hypothetical protein